jgi:hypothetical protein
MRTDGSVPTQINGLHIAYIGHMENRLRYELDSIERVSTTVAISIGVYMAIPFIKVLINSIWLLGQDTEQLTNKTLQAINAILR